MSSILDDPQKMVSVDKEKMCRIVEQFPEQCEHALKLAKILKIPDVVDITNTLALKYGKPRNVVVVGMGGSAIGGSLLKDWLKNTLSIPLDVCRSYHLPAYTNEKTLVLTVSYSGNTEETLSAYLEAISKKCMVLAFTSGGLLEEFNKKLAVPYVKLPKEYTPRNAVAYTFFPLVVALEKLKLLDRKEEEIREALLVLNELRDLVKSENPMAFNPSKQLATGLKESIPCICGYDIYESVALRMKTQFNENSKIPAKVEYFPELNHNETVGWSEMKKLLKKFSVVIIRDEKEEKEIKTRIAITRDLVFKKSAKQVLEVRAKGNGRLARMLSAMYVGDFASVYLAILNHVDPTPVRIIDEVKKQLERKVNKKMQLREQFKRIKAG